MTDFEKTQQLFKEIGLEFEQYVNDGFDIGDKNKGNCIKIKEGFGYGGFYAILYFDQNGKFDSHGCWE